MAKHTVTDIMFRNVIDNVVDNTLIVDPEDDEAIYDPLKEALYDNVIAVVDQLRAAHMADLSKAKKAAATNEPAKVKKSRKVKSGEQGSTNDYSKFVGLLKYLKTEGKETRADIPELANIQITVGEHFKDMTAPCAKRYSDYKDQLLYQEAPIDGQTMTLVELYDVITNAKSIDKGFGNGMTRAGILWGLTSTDDRQKILDTVKVNEP